MPQLPTEYSQLFELLDQLREGPLADEDDARLCQMLRESQAARAIYVRYQNLIAGLHWRWSREEHSAAVQGESLSQLASEEGAGSWAVGVFPPKRSEGVSRVVGAVGQGVRYLSTPGRFGLVTATVTCISLLLFFAQIPWSPFSDSRPTSRPTAPSAATQAAVLLDADACRWAGAAPQETLLAGEVLHLVEGVAQIQFLNGAQLRLIGPTQLRLESAAVGRLFVGQIAVHAPARAHGFTIRTRRADIVDLGTEFAVVAQEDDSAAVYVRAGKVRIYPPNINLPRQDLVAGAAVQIDAQGAYQPVNTATAKRLYAVFHPQLAVGDAAAFPTLGPTAVNLQHAPRIAYQVPAGTPGNQAYSGGLRMDFDVEAPIEVLALGAFDDQGNGFAPGTAITVELWERQNHDTPFDPRDDQAGKKLVTRYFSSANPGELVGGSRFLPLDSPHRLESGAYAIVARGFNAADKLANSGYGPMTWTVDDGHGYLHFVGLSAFGDEFPMKLATHPYRFAAGTFEYQPIVPVMSPPDDSQGDE